MKDDEFVVVDEMPPITHIHVKTIDRKFVDKKWLALFKEPNGNVTWMEQPVKPEIGQEQILYVIAHDSQESLILQGLVEGGAPSELIEHFMRVCAMAYGVWCEKSWDEVKVEGKEIKH